MKWCLGEPAPMNNLSSCLTFLQITACNFDLPINHLPPSLKQLKLQSNNFTQSLDHLPSSLKWLQLTLPYEYQHSLDHLPSSLTNPRLLQWTNKLDHLHTSLISLYMESSFNNSVDNLPNSLCLLFLPFFTKPIAHLPSFLTALCLSQIYSQPLLPLHPLTFLSHDMASPLADSSLIWQYRGIPLNVMEQYVGIFLAN
jgi:hypothetical protein